MIKILLSPHNDDESLFASAILNRERPHVIFVTDGIKHESKGISRYTRRLESIKAMAVFNLPVTFLGLWDTGIDKLALAHLLSGFDPDVVYAPFPDPEGNIDHYEVGIIAREIWGDKVRYYSTYKLHDLTPQGDVEIKLTEREQDMKEKALACYPSQVAINKPHFDAVKGKSEYLCLKKSF